MFTALLLAALGQCASGSCALPSAGFSVGTSFSGGGLGLFRPRIRAATFVTAPASVGAACYSDSYAAPSYGVYGYVPPPVVQVAAPAVTYIRPDPPVVVATVAPPALSEQFDRDGQSWRHADPAYLKAWLAGRNAALASMSARVVTRTVAATCACSGESCTCSVPGECGRAGCQSTLLTVKVPPPRLSR
jgi:hypothetical protein